MKSSMSKILAIAVTVIMFSCSSDDESTTPTPPETQGKITYNKHIKPAIDANCISCHGNPTTNGAPVSLTTYSEVKAVASSIAAAISKQAGEPKAMPPSGRLPQSTIDAVQKWIDDGLLKN